MVEGKAESAGGPDITVTNGWRRRVPDQQMEQIVDARCSSAWGVRGRVGWLYLDLDGKSPETAPPANRRSPPRGTRDAVETRRYLWRAAARAMPPPCASVSRAGQRVASVGSGHNSGRPPSRVVHAQHARCRRCCSLRILRVAGHRRRRLQVVSFLPAHYFRPTPPVRLAHFTTRHERSPSILVVVARRPLDRRTAPNN